MADVAFLSWAETASAGSQVASLVQSVPSGVANGDLLIWAVNIDLNALNFAFPAGWTQLQEITLDTDEAVLLVGYRTASSEPASYTFAINPPNPNDWGVSAMFAYRSAGAMTINVSTTATNNSPDSSPWIVPNMSMTTTAPNTKLVWIAAFDNLTSQAITSFTAPTGFTTRDSVNNPNWCSMFVAEKTQSAAGSTGTVTAGQATGTGSTGRMAVMLAIAGALIDRTLTADTATYAQTGVAVTFRRGLKLAASTTTYTHNGIAAALKVAHKFAATTATFTQTGVAATLRRSVRVAADTGAFIESGISTPVRYGRLVTAATSSFALTGNDATLTETEVEGFQAGSFAWTGNDATLTKVVFVVAVPDGYVWAGSDAALKVGHKLVATTDTFTHTGVAATLYRGRRLTATATTFDVTASDAAIGKTLTLATEVNTFALSGYAAALAETLYIACTTGTFAATAPSAAFKKTAHVDLAGVAASGQLGVVEPQAWGIISTRQVAESWTEINV